MAKTKSCCRSFDRSCSWQSQTSYDKMDSRIGTKFQDLKKLVSREMMLNYPDWSKPFEVHIGASDFQLGAVISQNNKLIAFSSRKLNSEELYNNRKRVLSSLETYCSVTRSLFGLINSQ